MRLSQKVKLNQEDEKKYLRNKTKKKRRKSKMYDYHKTKRYKTLFKFKKKTNK
jgi:hypothetical protein